MYLPKNSLSIY